MIIQRKRFYLYLQKNIAIHSQNQNLMCKCAYHKKHIKRKISQSTPQLHMIFHL